MTRDDPYRLFPDDQSDTLLGTTARDEDLSQSSAVKGSFKADPALSSADGSDLEVTRAEIERTRLEMSGTIDAISERLDPDVVARNAKDSVRQAVTEKMEETKDAVKGATIGKVQDAISTAGESIGGVAQRVQDAVAAPASTAGQAAQATGATVTTTSRSLWMTIRDHPIPAAMAGLSLGWLFMSARKEGTARPWAGYGATRATQPLEYAGEPANLAAQRSAYGGQTGSATWREPDSQGTGLGQKLSTVPDMARDTLGTIPDTAARVADQTRQGASQLVDKTRQGAGQLGSQARDNARQAQSGIQRMVQDNPLMVGAFVAGLGVMAGLMIPETDKENELLGGPHDALMEQAGQAAQETAKRVRHAAIDAAADAMK
ncbi:MAG TPA: DUF3618 domain-containing protein [Chloroflexota bacterium]|nr:DUF3618 domain-containing protein [Chloroflexota bacterium]